MRTIRDRILYAIHTRPQKSDWLYAMLLLLVYGGIYLPIGFANGFLTVEPRSDGATILGVTIGAFLSPGLTEELGFRALLIPHRAEPIRSSVRWFWVAFSWVGFVGLPSFQSLGPAIFCQSSFSSRGRATGNYLYIVLSSQRFAVDFYRDALVHCSSLAAFARRIKEI